MDANKRSPVEQRFVLHWGEMGSRNLAGFFEVTTAWPDQIRQWSLTSLPKSVKVGDKARELRGLHG